MEDEHRYASAVLRIEPELLDFIFLGINPGRFHFVPEASAAILKVNLKNRIRNGEGMECKECILAVPLATHAKHGADRGQANIPERFAIGLEHAELRAGILLILRQQQSIHYARALQHSVALWNDFLPTGTRR